MKNRYWRKQDGQQWRRPMAIIHTSDLGDLGKNCKGIQQWFSSVHSISERLNWIDWAEKFCWNSNYLKHLLTDFRPWSQQQGNYFIKIGPPRLQWIWNQNCKKKICVIMVIHVVIEKYFDYRYVYNVLTTSTWLNIEINTLYLTLY